MQIPKRLTMVPATNPEHTKAKGIDTIPPPTMVLMKAKMVPN